jgi:hypothetical protein
LARSPFIKLLHPVLRQHQPSAGPLEAAARLSQPDRSPSGDGADSQGSVPTGWEAGALTRPGRRASAFARKTGREMLNLSISARDPKRRFAVVN